MIVLPLLDAPINIRKAQERQEVFDPFRKKWIAYTPEEHVRQALLYHLTSDLGYPNSLIGVEKKVSAPGLDARFDIVVFNKSHQPWMLIECKAPTVPVDESTLRQLLRYNNTLQCSYWVLCNGITAACADARKPQALTWLDQLPDYEG